MVSVKHFILCSLVTSPWLLLLIWILSKAAGRGMTFKWTINIKILFSILLQFSLRKQYLLDPTYLASGKFEYICSFPHIIISLQEALNKKYMCLSSPFCIWIFSNIPFLNLCVAVIRWILAQRHKEKDLFANMGFNS